MTRRLFGLMRKEFLQFFRDRMVILLVLYTFVEIALCGWALTLDVRNLPMAVYDGDRTPRSRALAAAVMRLEGFRPYEAAATPEELERWVTEGRVTLGVVIPAGFDRAVRRGERAQVQLLVDGGNSNLAGQVLTLLARFFREYNVEMVTEQVGRSGAAASPFPRIRSQIRFLYMPELTFSHFVILTMLTISVLVLGMLLPAAGIVREKEAGTFEQLRVTPITGMELVLAKTVPMILLKLVGLVIGLGIAFFLFGVPLRGSLALFFLFSFLMFLSSMGIGVLTGVFTDNLQQTLLVAFFLFFPMAFLSGTMVPISNMPRVLQLLTYLSPLRYYVEATLGIFLKGVGLSVLWPQALALLGSGGVLMGIGVWHLRRSL